MIIILATMASFYSSSWAGVLIMVQVPGWIFPLYSTPINASMNMHPCMHIIHIPYTCMYVHILATPILVAI